MDQPGANVRCGVSSDPRTRPASAGIAFQRLGKIEEATAGAFRRGGSRRAPVPAFLSAKECRPTGGQFDWSLAGACLPSAREALEEIVHDSHSARSPRAEQPARRDAVGAALVFLDLLKANADLASQVLLGQAQQPATAAQPLADIDIHIRGHLLILPHAGPYHSETVEMVEQQGACQSLARVLEPELRHSNKGLTAERAD